jgi:uncharacterized protein YndB with AHSA1/START domain
MDDLAQDRQITLTRHLAASPAKVWRCWTDPALLPKWFGPEGFSCRTKTISLQEGGEWVFDMIGPDGTVWPNRHRYTHWVPKTRLEFTLDNGSDDESPIGVVVHLTPEGAGTRITQIMTLPTVAAKEQALGFGADRLGQTTLAKLEAMAASL